MICIGVKTREIALSEKNELIAIISSSVHDMKAPLMSISGFAEAMLDGTISKENHEKYLSVIRDEAARMQRICEELLEASRIETGTACYKNDSFDICESARRVLLSFEKDVEKKQLEVSFDAPEEGIEVVFDQSSLVRVLYNICENAVKFSYEKGYIHISFEENDEHMVIRIENSGDGISADELDRIFLPFYKSGALAGTGLGLFIVKRILEAQGASISAESILGRSMAFVVKIRRR